MRRYIKGGKDHLPYGNWGNSLERGTILKPLKKMHWNHFGKKGVGRKEENQGAAY